MGFGLPVEIKARDGFGNIANQVTPHHASWAVYHGPSAGIQATVTEAAVAGQRHYITGCQVVANESIKTFVLKCGSTTKMQINYIASDGYYFSFPAPLRAGENEAVTLEFTAAPTAGKWQVVNLQGYTE